MREVKFFEVRDKGTLIPVVAVRMRSANPREAWLIRRAGFGPDGDVVLVRLECSGTNRNATYDPHAWLTTGTRTLHVAHLFIRDNWQQLSSGDVVCVEYILGERDKPKETEQP